MSRDITYLMQILDAINKIEQYTIDGQEDFFERNIIQDAVMRNIEIIGEIAKRVSATFKDEHDLIPWRKMAGIRDVLIHDYDSIDMGIVWNVIVNELPLIKETLNKILMISM